jgi:hypothetical protein
MHSLFMTTVEVFIVELLGGGPAVRSAFAVADPVPG